ncbi:hypothetical protein [Nostoc sp.]
MKFRLSITWLLRSNKYKYLAIAYILKDAATLTKIASATSMKSTCVDLVCVAATSSRQLPKTIYTAITFVSCTTPVIMEAIAPMVTEFAVRAASRREVRTTPTPSTHHHSPLDLGCCCSELEVWCSHLEISCSEGEASSSELGTSSNLLQHLSSEPQHCTLKVQSPSYFLQCCCLRLDFPRFTGEPLPHFLNYCL